MKSLRVLLVLCLFATVRAQATKPIPDVASWAPADGIVQAVWSMGFGSAEQGTAETVAAELAKRPDGNRVLLILRAVNNLPKDPAEFIGFGLDDYAGRKYYGALFRGIIRPDFIALDEEWGYSNWALFAQPTDREAIAVATTVFSDPFARAAMPKKVAAITPDSFRTGAWWSPENQVIGTWNNWTAQLHADALDHLLYAQARAVWPGFVEYGNYSDCHFRFPVEDLNGWPGANLDRISRSCPALYLNCGNAVAPARGLKKHPLWNNLIRTINLARACAADGPTRAWVSYPAYSGDFGRQYSVPIMQAVWEQQIRHVAALNVKFIYWNPATPDKPEGDDAFAAKVFRENRVRRAINANQMTPIPYDADEIRTGDVLTRYEDFQKGLSQ